MGEVIKWAELSARERDALVAEKVMGRNEVMARYYADGGWSPTTDIAAAWEVVEKMHDDHDKPLELHVGSHDGTGVYGANAAFGLPDTIDEAWADVDGPYGAPEAICIAALRALGITVATMEG